MKCLVFALIVMVAINGMTAAPSFETSGAVCSPWLGYVSVIENKDNCALNFFYTKIHIKFFKTLVNYNFNIAINISFYNEKYCCITNCYDYSVRPPTSAVVIYCA